MPVDRMAKRAGSEWRDWVTAKDGDNHFVPPAIHSVDTRWLSPSVAWAVLPHAPSLAGMLTTAPPPPLDEGSIRACCNLTSPEVALVLD